MLIRRKYPVSAVLKWTRYEILFLMIYNFIILAIVHSMELSFIQVPWTPIALLGTAVSFLIGFQANSAYGRIWEARKIWGGIVNSSRNWGMKIRDFISNDHNKHPIEESELKDLRLNFIKRHIAWLTALRYAMRQHKPWEEFDMFKTNKEFSDNIFIPERDEDFDKVIQNYLSPEDIRAIEDKGNKATALLYLQSQNLKELKERGLIWEFSFLELENVLETLFELQGKSERIKNFPYPRQYSTISLYLVVLFALILPFGLIPIFENTTKALIEVNPSWRHFIWSMVPFSTIIAWALWLIQRVSMVGENPFEGGSNDVPISSIARGIEIDLLEQYNVDPAIIPPQFPIQNGVQM